MQNVILIVHLILALSLIGIVLLQRSEGGGLGMGGGGGGVMSGRAAATALGKLTWAFAIGFIITSITLTILAAANTEGASVVDRVTDAPEPAPATAPVSPATDGQDLLPPAPAGNTPLVPQNADTPLVPPAAE
ncbi:preprotein translocase subunit SecG [Tropicimonas sp. IMCC6043]|uniref:preprotein translocase subunit SecG n=1 Tax=Tropicimonas sp. IMCC6043 TaxID=2510645 RepID=UPI00101BC400|nr:preprotein translocase subunit SecG [Tropicimonas sp. IMCC6043]RYH09576.1 preprotein translocase subunit SecG [Tropicimonas sp. IMCC6043]